MKKLLIILIVTAVSLGTSAQKRYAGRGGYARSHVVVTVGRPYYYPHYYWYYDPFYYPYGYYQQESRLDIKIEGIRNDYQDKIWSAKHDKSMSKAKRKKIVHQLKYERDEAINKAKEDYYKSR